MNFVQGISGMFRRRLRPFEHLTLNDTVDIEAHQPHVLQLWKRLRYRWYLQRHFKPGDDVERARFERLLRTFLPRPLGVTTWLIFGYCYAYPATIGMRVLAGYERGPLTGHVLPGSIEPAKPGEDVDVDVAHYTMIHRAMEKGAFVQVHGTESTRALQIAAAALPKWTLYVRMRSENIRSHPTNGATLTTNLLASHFGLTTLQVDSMLHFLNALHVRPVVFFDLTSKDIGGYDMVRHLEIQRKHNKYDVVFANHDPTAASFLLGEHFEAPNFVALLTDVAQPHRAVKAGSLELAHCVWEGLPSPMIKRAGTVNDRAAA